MRLYAHFDEEGRPAHIREEWMGVEGMDPLPEGMTLEDAARLCLVKGRWVKRLPRKPTAEDMARAEADDRAARDADLEAAIQAALDAETPLLVAEMFECDHAPDWLKARRQDIRDRFATKMAL